jgi:uncharacterized integral membrane protein
VKYVSIIFFILIFGYLALFINLNSAFINLDLYFYEFNGITSGIALLITLLIGMLLSFILQIPVIFRKKDKIKKEKK